MQRLPCLQTCWSKGRQVMRVAAKHCVQVLSSSWARAAREREPRPRCFLPLGASAALVPEGQRTRADPCSGSPFQGRGPHAPLPARSLQGACPSPCPSLGPPPRLCHRGGRGGGRAGHPAQVLAAPARCPLPADRFGAASRSGPPRARRGASSRCSSPSDPFRLRGPSPGPAPSPEPASQSALDQPGPRRPPPREHDVSPPAGLPLAAPKWRRPPCRALRRASRAVGPGC